MTTDRETNLLVDDALGDTHTCDRPGSDYFNPAVNLNDAFWAAEQVGLFGHPHHCTLRGTTPPLEFVIECGVDSVWYVRSNNPALAICKAILKEKELNDELARTEAS